MVPTLLGESRHYSNEIAVLRFAPWYVGAWRVLVTSGTPTLDELLVGEYDATRKWLHGLAKAYRAMLSKVKLTAD